MGTIPVIWLNYNEDVISRGFWDQGMLEDVFSNKMWSTAYEFRHYEKWGEFYNASETSVNSGAVIVFPARNQVQFIDKLNEAIANFPWVQLFLTGDEESDFPIEQISHPRIRIWVMSPQEGRHDQYGKLGTGYPAHMHQYTPETAPDKTLDFFFAGQTVNNYRRDKMAQMLVHIQKDAVYSHLRGEVRPSGGFTQGLPHDEYFAKLASAKAAIVPSGSKSPDSFRLFEALEMGCVPIADTFTDRGDATVNYWPSFFGEMPPFPILQSYDDLYHWIREATKDYPVLNNKVSAWWQAWKRKWVLQIRDQIQELSGIAPQETTDSQITVLMPTSPVSMHPSTAHIEETINTVRGHLPDSEIFIMIDGVRPEQEDRRANYEEYQRRLLWLCNHKYQNVLPIRFEEFSHQAAMTKKTLSMVKTPYVLFVEHDTPLTPDYPIEWNKLTAAIGSGEANVIRFHHESHILPVHEDTMLSPVESVAPLGVQMRKTCQWSQRPHLASAAFYRDILQRYFSDESRSFIEDRVYGFCYQEYAIEGMMGWNLWKLWIYTPEGETILRSYHLDSRQGAEKWDDKLVF